MAVLHRRFYDNLRCNMRHIHPSWLPYHYHVVFLAHSRRTSSCSITNGGRCRCRWWNWVFQRWGIGSKAGILRLEGLVACTCACTLECLAIIQRFFSDIECNSRLQFDCVFVALLPTLAVCDMRSIFDVKVNHLLVCVWVPTDIMWRHSDATGERFGHITIPLLIGIAGFMMAMATMNTAVRYLSL